MNYNKNKKFSQTGAALVITMLLVTAISVVIFSVGRSTMSEIRQISQLEDAELAFQAAESGIEAGLLLYRYNHNVEVPSGVSGGMDVSVDKAMRVNVSESKLESASLEINSNLLSIKKDQQYYDLRLWHKNSNENGISREIVSSQACQTITDTNGREVYPDYCVPNNPNEVNGSQSIPALAKDGSVEYDSHGLEQIKIKAEFYRPPKDLAEREKFNLEYIPIDKDGQIITNGTDLQNKKLFRYNEILRPAGQPRDVSITNQFRLKAWGADLKQYVITAEAKGNNKLDSRYSYIESTGYFASAKRKITVKIDRQTGAIFNSYDFVLMSPESITGQ